MEFITNAAYQASASLAAEKGASSIFEECGEGRFREVEAEIIDQAFPKTEIVMILGAKNYLNRPTTSKILKKC